MKRHTKLMVAAGCTAVIAVTSALSQPPLISVDEFGNGTIGGTPLTWQTGLVEAQSGLATLSYNLPFLGNRGDVVLMEPSSGVIGDLIRFDGQGHLFFFSDGGTAGDPPDSFADVGIPSPNAAAPILVFNEVGPEAGPNGLWGYTPTLGGNDPGGTSAPIIYDFISDIPEPSPAALLAGGLGMLAFVQRRRKLARV